MRGYPGYSEDVVEAKRLPTVVIVQYDVIFGKVGDNYARICSNYHSVDFTTNSRHVETNLFNLLKITNKTLVNRSVDVLAQIFVKSGYICNDIILEFKEFERVEFVNGEDKVVKRMRAVKGQMTFTLM